DSIFSNYHSYYRPVNPCVRCRRQRVPGRPTDRPRRTEEDTLEGEEVRPAVVEPGQETVAVRLQELGVELRAQPPPVCRQQGALRPFHHLVPRCQPVGIHLQSDLLLAVAETVEQEGVLPRRQD